MRVKFGHFLPGDRRDSRGVHHQAGGAAGQGRQDLRQFPASQVSLDGQGGPAAGGKGGYCGIGAGGQVAAGKDAGDGGGQANRVCVQLRLGRGIEPQPGAEEPEIRGLTHRDDDRIHLQGML